MNSFQLVNVGFSLIAIGFTASLLAGLATTVGALPVLFVKRLSARVQGVMLGFGAGVMLAASFFSLILPGLETAHAQGAGDLQAAVLVILGILIGAATLWFAHQHVPHEHFILGREGPVTDRLRRIWLFVIAITIHNFPEGLAVGVGFGGGDIANGVTLGIGIGLQNMPEGLVVAVALLTGLLGITAVSFAGALLPWGLAFAAGAMIFVISDEIIPETHREGHEIRGTVGLMVGFVIMMFLDVVLG
jgi:ZIP family zinc transporter